MQRWILLWMLLPALAGARPKEEPGAVLAPAILPAGESAMAMWIGAPELALSIREGLVSGGGEVEARAAFDYLIVAAILEGTARKQMGWFDGKLVPELGGGLILNSGAQYAFTSNASGVYLQLSPGAMLMWREQEHYSSRDSDPYMVWRFTLPLELGLTRPGAWRLLSKVSVGMEQPVDNDLSFIILGELGVGAAQKPGESVQLSGTAGVSVGVGLRQF